MSEFVATRKIGDAVVTVISEGTLRWNPKFEISDDERRRVLPDADGEGKLTLGLNLAHVRLGSVSIVIDPGCDDPSSTWSREFAAKWPGLTRTSGLEAALRHIGVSPDDVTHVLITHAHEDHYAGVAMERGSGLALRFQNARHVIGRRDWEEHPSRSLADSPLNQRLGLAVAQRRLDTIDHEREVEPGVTMYASPGETPGHCTIRITSGGKRFYYLGDLFHLPSEIEHIAWAPPNRDVTALAESRRRLLAEASEQDSVLVFSHDRFPAWGRIVRANGGYRWRAD